MTAIDVLKKARDILEPEGAWTKGEYARDVNRKRVAIISEDAVCFCASGAIYRAAMACRKTGEIYDKLSAPERLSNIVGSTIAIFNDASETTHLQVLMAFDFAILDAMDEA